MRRIILAGLLTAGALPLAACGPAAEQDSASSSVSSSAGTTTAVAPSPAATVPSATVPTTSPTTSAAAFQAFAMPNFVGIDLQTAQDQVQTHRILYSRSHDLRGTRHQILDSDWIVCAQNIPAGQTVSQDVEGQIDFGVVKRSERCP